MKILICSVSSVLGGMERRMEAETRLLGKMGHEVVVATAPFRGLKQWKTEIDKAGGKYISWRPYKFIERQHWPAVFRWLAMTTLPMLRKEKFDLAHIAMPWNYAGLSIAHVLRQANVPFVISIHCKFDTQILPEHGRTLVKQALTGMVGGYAVSEPVKESFMRMYAGLLPPTTLLKTILNGIDTERFKPDAVMRRSVRQRLGLDAQKFIVMFCGRIDPMKRPLLAARVFSELSKKNSEARLLVLGEGAELPALKAEIQSLGLSDRVVIVGQVSDTAPYYAASDIYLSTSRNQEGCPLAAAEALACGLPAVVPDDDVFRSIYGSSEAVRRCDPTGQSGWDSALIGLATLNENERRDLSQQAQSFTKTHLSQNLMEKNFALFYQNLFDREQNDR